MGCAKRAEKIMNKKQSPLNRLRGTVVELKGPFEPIEEDSWEALKPPSSSIKDYLNIPKYKKRPQGGRENK